MVNIIDDPDVILPPTEESFRIPPAALSIMARISRLDTAKCEGLIKAIAKLVEGKEGDDRIVTIDRISATASVYFGETPGPVEKASDKAWKATLWLLGAGIVRMVGVETPSANPGEKSTWRTAPCILTPAETEEVLAGYER